MSERPCLRLVTPKEFHTKPRPKGHDWSTGVGVDRSRLVPSVQGSFGPDQVDGQERALRLYPTNTPESCQESRPIHGSDTSSVHRLLPGSYPVEGTSHRHSSKAKVDDVGERVLVRQSVSNSKCLVGMVGVEHPDRHCNTCPVLTRVKHLCFRVSPG